VTGPGFPTERPGGRPALYRALPAGAALLIAFALGYRLGSPALLDEPNDGQYAEVAREMLESGDWVSPTLNGVLFLNKPPLLYWLIATSYALLGVNELAARLPGALITALTFFLLFGLARETFDSTTAFLSVCVYAGMPSTLIEARLVRPDTLLVASTVGALWAFAVVMRGGDAERRGLLGLQIALASGLLAKGIVAILLPGFAIAVVILTERRWKTARLLLSPRSWWLFLAIVAPWHLIAALRHEGFLWDYIVNQHFLFFLDKKEPRDSIPVSLGVFWAAFFGRTFPWTLLLLLALIRPYRGPARTLVLAWVLGTLAFFSAATSRLEHYALPALPGVALLVADLLARQSQLGAGRRRLLTASLALLAVGSAAAIWAVPAALAGIDWLPSRDLTAVAHSFFAVFFMAAALALVLSRRRPLAVAPILAGAILASMPLVQRGLVLMAPFNSSAPVAALIRIEAGDEPTEVVFEAPVEYQSVAGLNFYLGHAVTLLRPPGFVEPPYLVPYRDELFIDRAELGRRWRDRNVIFVSDPLADPDRPIDEIVPKPFRVIGQRAGRWIVTNQP
jgi:4-amino-4-deoxy-L-arabinose transferase-like glycosyltransferase